MMSRIRIAMGVVALAAVTACNEPLLPESPLAVRVDSLSLFAFNGSPRTLPSALTVFSRQAVPISTAHSFDVAFDINAEGRVLIYPVQLLVSGLGGRTGLRLMTPGSFAELRRAPLSGYVYDQVLAVGPGDVVAIQTVAEICPFFSPQLFAKLAIDSVIPEERRVRLRFSANPNCGYISLEPGRSRE